MPVALADPVKQPNQVLDDRDHLFGLLALGVRLIAGHRGGSIEHADLKRLVAPASLGDPELDRECPP